MKLRDLADDFRDFPATLTFCLIWIVVFVAMACMQAAEGTPVRLVNWLVVGIGGGHRFGDWSLQDLARGEVWRLVTATFVHYSVLHIALNLLAMYQIGTLVELWYGTPQFILIYGLTGGGGNLVSALIRYSNGSDPRIHSGGGSVVIMGLIGLCAVVGWRSRTPQGALLGRQMTIVLVVTALIGIALPRYIDNWGHLGGTLVGGVLGFAHRGFLRRVSGPGAVGAGAVMGLVLVLCGVAQVLNDRMESPARQEAALRNRMTHLDRIDRTLTMIEQLVSRRTDADLGRGMLNALGDVLDPRSRAEVPRLKELFEISTTRPLSDEEAREFEERVTGLRRQLRGEYVAEQRRLWELQGRRGRRAGGA